MGFCTRAVLCAMCTLCLILSTHAKKSSSDGGLMNSERMQNMVQNMLGFKEKPRSGHHLRLEKEVPKYMKDLYETVKDGTMPMAGDTIRSIEAVAEKVNGQPMFVFNLSAIAGTEEDVIRGDIHLFKRKKAHYNKRADLEFIVHEIALDYTKEIGKITLTPAAYGWQWLDVTNLLKRVSERRSSAHALGLTFRVSKPHGNSNILHLKRFIYKHSVPYLIINSNNSQDIDINQISSLSDSAENSQTVSTGPVSDVLLSEKQTLRSKRSLDDNSADIPLYNSRARSLSILTNEIPEDPEDYNRPYPVSVKEIQTHPRILQTRKESRHKISDPRLIPYPVDYVDKKKRKKNRRKKGRGRHKNHLDLPKDWDDLRKKAEGKESEKSCGRKRLTVDFKDIGWGEWIISPKTFKLNYCSGVCTFPLTKKMRPSNHATIQSLVNAIGVYPDVPAPCCVPDKMSSITLLYFDENRNVVLKNYPNMTVQKCACR